MISVAAELAAMHPQTLRMYEARGLIEPKRSPKGTRLYSHDDVERLRRIQEMTTELGMNLAGVERVFELEDKLGRLQRKVSDALEHRAATLQDEIAPSSRRSASRCGPRSCATRRPARRSSRSGTCGAGTDPRRQHPQDAAGRGSGRRCDQPSRPHPRLARVGAGAEHVDDAERADQDRRAVQRAPQPRPIRRRA